MKRALAVVAAVAMVVVSLVVRSRIDDDSSAGSTGGRLRLLCVEELAGACEAFRSAAGRPVDVTVEPGGATVARLSSGDQPAGFDAWLAPDELARQVDEARQRNGLPPRFALQSPVVASSPLVIVVWNDVKGSLGCPQVSWKCLGDAVGRGIMPGHPPPDSAVGTLVLGQIAASYFGRTDLSTEDLDDDPNFGGWFTALERALLDHNVNLERMLAQGPTAASAWGTTDAEATSELRAARKPVTKLYPAPMATAQLVVASVAGSSAGARLQSLLQGDAGRAALHGAGWKVGGAGPDGLPPAGLLTVLAQRAEQAGR